MCIRDSLGNGVIANTQALNLDFAVLIGGKCLVVPVIPDNSEREALHLAVRGSLG